MKRENETYKFLRFEKSKRPGKKYDAVLKNKKTGGEKRVPFGDSNYEQYKDSTGLGLYSKKNHLDKQRRDNYRSRHQGEGDDSNFPKPGFFAYNFLW